MKYFLIGISALFMWGCVKIHETTEETCTKRPTNNIEIPQTEWDTLSQTDKEINL